MSLNYLKSGKFALHSLIGISLIVVVIVFGISFVSKNQVKIVNARTSPQYCLESPDSPIGAPCAGPIGSQGSCASGLICQGPASGVCPGTCQVPPGSGEGFICTGSDPSNSAICSGDNQNLTANIPKTLVSSCGAPKCEYVCQTGYVFNPTNPPSCQLPLPICPNFNGTSGAPCNNNNQCNSSLQCSGPAFPGCSSGSCLPISPSSNEICGFAWAGTSESDHMGAGWVSFNSKDCDTDGDGTIETEDNPPVGCPIGQVTQPYAVTVDSSNRLDGNAWSSNLGWIKFGSLSGFPTTGGTFARNAQIDGQQLKGFMRVCTGTADKRCGTMEARTDGWDGWISVNGDGSGSGSYNVSYSIPDRTFGGYAWGGEVVGWLNWDPGVGNGVRMCDASQFDFALSNSGPIVIQQGQNGTVTVTNSLVSGNSEEVSLSAQLVNGDPTLGSIDLVLDPNSCSPNCTSNLRIDVSEEVPVGTYAITVTGTAGSLSRSTDFLLSVLAPSSASLTCEVIGEPFVNKPITWRATVNNPSALVLPVTYTWTLTSSGVSETIIHTYSDPNTPADVDEVQRTYNTVGRKTADVVMQDSSSPALSASCPTDLFTNIKVKPKIKEI